ncbi:LytR/AlgR family response regulator transcription factor, partial [Ruminococcus sp.]
ISPMEYIKPSIMASALLLRPFSKEMLSTVINNLLIEYLKKYSSGDGEKALVIENKGERQIIPYTNIMYLESRSKKIYVIVGNKEYSYYDTLDNLENKLGSEFIRCHRSYIVSRYYIKKIQLSQNLIVLNDDSLIPISRSYKSRVKELK